MPDLGLRRRQSDERRGGFADHYLLPSLRRSASAVRRYQGGLGRHRAAAGAVARKPLGLPSNLGPRLGSRAGCRHRHAGIRPLRRSPGTDRSGRLGSVPGRPDRRVGPGGSARRRPGRRHGRSALPCREGSGARYELDHRRRRGPLPDRSGRRAQGHHRGAESGRRARAGRQDQHRLRGRGRLPRATASPKSTRTMSAPTTSGASRSRPGSCGITPSRTRCCATCCRRSPRRPRSWPGATMTSCRGRTTSTSTTSSRTARSILSTRVTSRGSKQRRNTAAWSPIGSAADIGASERARCQISPQCDEPAWRSLLSWHLVA